MAERSGRGEVTAFPLNASEVEANPGIIRHPDARQKRRNRSGQAAGISKEHIAGPFAPRLIEMLKSPAYRVLSLAEHRVLARLEIEFEHHGRKAEENGNLACTHDQFVEYGAHPNAVAPAVRALVALGFVVVTRKGSAGNAEHRQPTLYLLTYRPFGSAKYVMNGWRRIGTIEEAEAVASAARARPADKLAQEFGRKGGLASQAKKQIPASRKRTDVSTENVLSGAPFSTENVLRSGPSLSTFSVALSRISQGGPDSNDGDGASSRPPTPGETKTPAPQPNGSAALTPAGSIGPASIHILRPAPADALPSDKPPAAPSLQARQAEARAKQRAAEIERRKAAGKVAEENKP